MFLEPQVIILEWFLKDHATLKTEVLMLKIQPQIFPTTVALCTQISLSTHSLKTCF